MYLCWDLQLLFYEDTYFAISCCPFCVCVLCCDVMLGLEWGFPDFLCLYVSFGVGDNSCSDE